MKTTTIACLLLAGLSLGANTAHAASNGCVPLEQFNASHAGKFTMEEDPNAERYRLTFHYTDATGTRSGSANFPPEVPAGIMGDSFVVCGGSVIIDDGSFELGGILFIGRLHAGGITVSHHYYSSGYDDSAELDYRDGVLLVTTLPGGTIRLLEETDPDSDLRYSFVPETLRCSRDDDEYDQELSLQVNTAGRPVAISYSAWLPGTPGQRGHCNVVANSIPGLDGMPTSWEHVDPNTEEISWDDADQHSDDPQPSRLRIARKAAQYTVDFSELIGSSFCGMAYLPRTLTLAQGQSTCPAVTWGLSTPVAPPASRGDAASSE